MFTCCKAVVHGSFADERLVRLGLRHTTCRRAGTIEGITISAWFHQRRIIKTGEVYQ
jgi:hypothetical protein